MVASRFTRLVLAILMLLFFVLISQEADAKKKPRPSKTRVTVQQVWTVDTDNNSKAEFAPEDPVRYTAQVSSSGKKPVPVTVTFSATGPDQIYYWQEQRQVARGVSSFYSESTIPPDAQPGPYTIKVTVTYGGKSSARSSQFEVTSPITVDTVWTTDTDYDPTTVFVPGDPILYRAELYNPNSQAVPATLTSRAVGPDDQEIYYETAEETVDRGWHFYTSEATVPEDAPPGFYTIEVTVTYGGRSSAQSSQFQVTPSYTVFSIPTSDSQPADITSGPDGNLWFTEQYGNKIGRITPSGTITEFPVPTNNSGPFGITSGPDGNLWFTEIEKGQIGIITPSGFIAEYENDDIYNVGTPYRIASGPDGNLWFTDLTSGLFGGLIPDIVRMTPYGIVTQFPTPTWVDFGDITAGPDGNLWFTVPYGGKIGRITPSGTITEFPIPTASDDSFTIDITAGPDGNLWFTEWFDGTEGSEGKIGRVTPSGTITEFPIPGYSSPDGITSGSDGNLWFADGNKIGRITPTGIITRFPLGNGISAEEITSGPDGNLWFTDRWHGKIGRITPQ